MKESSQASLPQMQDSATIIDFMAVVQTSMSCKPTTFQDLSVCLETAISSAFRESSKVVLVPGRYDIALSIKANERSRRQNSSSLEIIIHSGNHKLPTDLQCYLLNPQNKKKLVNYVFQTWSETFRSKLQNNQTLVLTHLNGSTTEITCQTSTKFKWTTDHEEADSKMFVICKYMMDVYNEQRIFIASPDTDVAVIACYQFVDSLLLLREQVLEQREGILQSKTHPHQ